MEDAIINDKMEEVINRLANMSENSNELNSLLEVIGDNILNSVDKDNKRSCLSRAAKTLRLMAMKIDSIDDTLTNIAANSDIDHDLVELNAQISDVKLQLRSINDQFIVKNMLDIQYLYPMADDETKKKVYINNLFCGYEALQAVDNMIRQSKEEEEAKEDTES